MRAGRQVDAQVMELDTGDQRFRRGILLAAAVSIQVKLYLHRYIVLIKKSVQELGQR
jgi:hypothetical protein